MEFHVCGERGVYSVCYSFPARARVLSMIRPRLFVLAVLIALVVPALAQKKSTPKAPATRPHASASAPSGVDEQDLVDLEKHLLDFERDKNSKELEPWIAEDFSYTDASGKEMTRDEFLKNIKSFAGNIDWLSADKMRVRVFGNVAVVTGVQQRRTSQGDVDMVAKPTGPPPVTTNSAFTDVFRRRASEWELVQKFVGEMGQKVDAAPSVDEAPPAAKPAQPDAPPKIVRPAKPPGAR